MLDGFKFEEAEEKRWKEDEDSLVTVFFVSSGKKFVAYVLYFIFIYLFIFFIFFSHPTCVTNFLTVRRESE